MITTINDFRNKINENIEELNSNKEVKLKAYQEIIKNYNSRKESLKNIFSKSQDKWEEEAEKIIEGNVYLGLFWKLTKLTKIINDDEEKLKNSELTDIEKKEIQTRINDNKKKLSDDQNELNKQIREDLSDIQRL
jgi:hypothetical protein